MFLHPDDRLREVQARRLQHRRVVRTVGVAAPDVEATTRHQHAGHVAEPGREQLVERVVGDEVVRQRPVLGPHLLLRRLGLLGMPREVEPLVMLCAGERLRPAAMALLERGSTFTLYGGSVFTR